MIAQIKETVVSDLIATYFTIRSSQLQIGDDFIAFQEVFIGNNPTHCERGEETEPVFRRELLGTVVTHIGV